MEFVDSIADLYRRAGFRAHAIDVALDAFAREARRRFGRESGAGPDELAALAALVAHHSPVEPGRLLDTLRAAERGRHDPRLTDAELTGLVARVSSLQTEVFHGR